jgi:glycosyltransferase involved in cell wall biosynthesis
MSTATRVAFCTEVLADYKLHLHRRLARLPGYEVMVWHGPGQRGRLPADTDPRDEFPHRSARNLHFRLGLPAVWQRVWDELWRFRPDVVILEDGLRILSNWRILDGARRRGVPVILYSHGENRLRDRTRGPLLGEALEALRRAMHRRADAMVLYTEASVAHHRRRHPGSACFAATNTLDTDAIRGWLDALPPDHRAALRARLGVAEGTLLVASVARLIPEHDPRPLFASIRNARAVGSDVRLLVVGSGPLEAACRAWLLDLPPGERGVFHLLPRQPLDETTRLLAACDVYVVPGSAGLGIAHAFAVGLPVVASADAIGSAPESSYLEDGRNALIVRDLAKPLVNALVRLEREPLLRRSLAEHAERYAREQLSPQRQVQGFVAAIEHVLARRAGGARAALA